MEIFYSKNCNINLAFERFNYRYLMLFRIYEDTIVSNITVISNNAMNIGQMIMRCLMTVFIYEYSSWLWIIKDSDFNVVKI